MTWSCPPEVLHCCPSAAWTWPAVFSRCRLAEEKMWSLTQVVAPIPAPPGRRAKPQPPDSLGWSGSLGSGRTWERGGGGRTPGQQAWTVCSASPMVTHQIVNGYNLFQVKYCFRLQICFRLQAFLSIFCGSNTLKYKLLYIRWEREYIFEKYNKNYSIGA